MTEVTLELPDSLAASLSDAGNDLPRILELGVRALTANGRPEYDGMADVQVEADFRHHIEDFGQLRDGIEVPGQIFDHQPNPGFPRSLEQLANGHQVLLDDKAALGEWRQAIRMEVHPRSA